MKVLAKALFIDCAGKSVKSLTDAVELQAMNTLMLGNRICERANGKQMIIMMMLLIGMRRLGHRKFRSTLNQHIV